MSLSLAGQLAGDLRSFWWCLAAGSGREVISQVLGGSDSGTRPGGEDSVLLTLPPQPLLVRPYGEVFVAEN